MTLKEYLESYDEPLNEGLFDKVKLLFRSLKKNFKTTILALSLAANLITGINVAADNSTEVLKMKQEVSEKISKLNNLNFFTEIERKVSNVDEHYSTPEQIEKLSRQIEAQKHILGEVTDAYNKISILKPAKSQEKKIEDAIKKAETCIKFSEDTLKEIKEENHNDMTVRVGHKYIK